MSSERTMEALKKKENNIVREFKSKFKDFDIEFLPFHETIIREVYREGIISAIEYYKNGKWKKNRATRKS